MNALRRPLAAHLLALLAGSALFVLSTGTPSAAQTGSPAGDRSASGEATQLGEIVVTAQFREQRLQDTPLAITAIDSALLEARGQTSLAQVTEQAPSVQLRPTGASYGPSLTASIRGIGQYDFNPALEPGVGVYVDDVYYPQLTGAIFDLLDLERVEVLRGPQGTLAGRNSEGGAIKMYSRKPSADGGGYLEATYGSGNRIGLRGGADFQIASNLFGRISGVYKHQDGYVDNLDFGCVYPAGGPATFVNNQGVTLPVNPVGGVPATRPAGECRTDRLGEVGYQALRGVLLYQPSDDFEFTLIADYTKDERSQPGEVLLATESLSSPNFNAGRLLNVPYDNRFLCGKFCNFGTNGHPAATFFGLATPPGGQPLGAVSGSKQMSLSIWGVSGNVHWDVNDRLSIDNIIAYREFETSFDSDDDLSPVNISYGLNHLENWHGSEEIRLNAKVSDTVTATVGAYYFKQSTTYASVQDLRYVGIPVAPGVLLSLMPLQFYQPDVIDAEAKAVFANAGWEIVPGLNLNLGARYTEESKDYHYFRYNLDGRTINPYLDPVGAIFGAGAPGALTGAVSNYKGERTDYRVSLDYRFSPELMVYGTIATGFKGGGTNPRPFHAGQVIPYDPETLTNYEIGFKSDLFDRRVRLNVSAFYDPFKDIQLTVGSCPDSPCAATLNSGDATLRGIEAELFARPWGGLQIDASASYLDFKYESLRPEAMYPQNRGGVLLSDPILGAPEYKWSLGVQYEFAIADGQTITPRLDVSHEAKVYTFPNIAANGQRALSSLPEFTLANAKVTYRNEDAGLDIALEVTNLTDEYYLLSNFDLRIGGAGFDKGQPARPREWALSVRKSF